MNTSSFIAATLLLALLLSCNRDITYRLSAAYGSKVAVAEDKETMERIIDCAVTRNWDHLSLPELLAKREVFLVENGSQVIMMGGFTFSRARKVRILEGDFIGKEGWVYERMLVRDHTGALSSSPQPSRQREF